MKNIKYFKYKDTYSFERFLNECRCCLSDVNGYSIAWKERYNGNVLMVYIIYFNNGEYKYFNVLFFKGFDEYTQTSARLKINKLLSWYDSANIVKYKFEDRYVITKY